MGDTDGESGHPPRSLAPGLLCETNPIRRERFGRTSAVQTRSCAELDRGAASEKQSQFPPEGGGSDRQAPGATGGTSCTNKPNFWVPDRQTRLPTSRKTPGGVTANLVVAPNEANFGGWAEVVDLVSATACRRHPHRARPNVFLDAPAGAPYNASPQRHGHGFPNATNRVWGPVLPMCSRVIPRSRGRLWLCV
jgi:hypothetical protein